MPITQIPFQDPVAPPEKPQPEQLGLYDAQRLGRRPTAMPMTMRHSVPHLLIQLQDDLARSRWREAAAWISIIVHLLLASFWRVEHRAVPGQSHAVDARSSPCTPNDLTNRQGRDFSRASVRLAEAAAQAPKTNIMLR
jgi:hypothetical protein